MLVPTDNKFFSFSLELSNSAFSFVKPRSLTKSIWVSNLGNNKVFLVQKFFHHRPVWLLLSPFYIFWVGWIIPSLEGSLGVSRSISKINFIPEKKQMSNYCLDTWRVNSTLIDVHRILRLLNYLIWNCIVNIPHIGNQFQYWYKKMFCRTVKQKYYNISNT